MTVKALISVYPCYPNKQKHMKQKKNNTKPGPAQIHRENKTSNKNTLNILS